MPPAEPDAETAIQTYTHAAERRLKPALDAAVRRRDAALQHVADYEQSQSALAALRHSQSHHPPPSPPSSRAADAEPPALRTRTTLPVPPDEPPAPLEALVDVGQRFFVRARVLDAQRVVLDVGAGVRVDMSLAEADAVVEDRLAFYARDVDACVARIAELSQQLEEIVACLAQLKAHSGTPIADVLARLPPLQRL